MISIVLKQNLAATPIRIRDTLLEHNKLNRFFNANFLLINQQNDGEIVGGKGAIRQVSMMGVKFNELIVSADNTHISYQIMGNKPVADHRGNIEFCENNTSAQPMTEITYKIRCKSPWWLPRYVLSSLIKKDISQALKKLAIHLEGSNV